MKSLSDYTKILRDTATNLNLHGESVEMVVQMLANALYISEVEHVAYSQEASLERASLENSKIQHCVNQMYSVYRGANPRVIMNIKATKLFEFNPHQEIIKSNNYRVYYLGYFNEDTNLIEYSPKKVYPDTMVTIIGLCSSSIYEDSWTVGYQNSYYRTIPESNLSSDLYLTINGNLTDTTRIFSDHLRQDLPFDLTLPGYGMRLYYPESLQGESGINTNYSISVYKYLELDTILESEKKALKMTGSIITPFSNSEYDREWILSRLGAEETYPGLVFIPETSRDGISTLHHKANRERYSGTYLATNSDLSWLLYEYYPNKIRRGGVTYVFSGAKSTEVKEITSERDITSQINKGGDKFLELWSGLKNSWTEYDLGYLPPGTITLKYQQSGKLKGSNASYDILPGYSVIPVYTASRSYNQKGIDTMTIQIIKNSEGVTETISTGSELSSEGLTLYYYYPSVNNERVKYTSKSDSQIVIPVPEISSQNNQDLEITLYRGNVLVDTEYVPFTYTPVQIGTVTIKEEGKDEEEITTITNSGTGEFYTLDLENDTIYIQTDYEGKTLTSSNTIATLYYNGESMTGKGCVYSIIPVSDLKASINSGTGEIEITEISENKTSCTLSVIAKYQGRNTVKNLIVKKSISNLSNYKVPSFEIKGEGYQEPLVYQTVSTEVKETKITIPPRTFKSLGIIKTGDIKFIDCVYTYTYTTLLEVLKSDEVSIPTLYLYYIPYSGFNTLDELEKSEFISKNKAYYITHKIEIEPGTQVIARFDISLDLYRNTNLDSEILEILQRFEYLFGVDFTKGSDAYNEIRSLITKISEVKNVDSIEISYLDPSTRNSIEITSEDIPIYYRVECNISSIVRS